MESGPVTSRSMGWHLCSMPINNRVPLVLQFPLRGALALAQAVSIRGDQTVFHSGMSAASEDEQQRPHGCTRAGLPKEMPG